MSEGMVMAVGNNVGQNGVESVLIQRNVSANKEERKDD